MKDIVCKIIWSTIEDFVGLWEILWELNSTSSEKTQKDNQDNIKNILKYFLEQNFVVFYLSKWGSDELNELKFNEALEALENGKYWSAPAIGEKCIKIGATEKGEKNYDSETGSG